MTAITLNSSHQAGHVRQGLETVLAALREMLDAFVSNRMRKAAAEAEHARSPLLQNIHSQSTNPQ